MGDVNGEQFRRIPNASTISDQGPRITRHAINILLYYRRSAYYEISKTAVKALIR